jgi:hypothetical protein
MLCGDALGLHRKQRIVNSGISQNEFAKMNALQTSTTPEGLGMFWFPLLRYLFEVRQHNANMCSHAMHTKQKIVSIGPHGSWGLGMVYPFVPISLGLFVFDLQSVRKA